MTDDQHQAAWRDPAELHADPIAGGDPRVGIPELRFTDGTEPDHQRTAGWLAQYLRGAIASWRQRTGRTQPERKPMQGTEITLTTESTAEVTDWVREQVAAHRADRETPTTHRVDAATAWRMVSGGMSTPQLLGWPDMHAIAAELDRIPGDPIEPVAEWQCPTTNPEGTEHE